MRSVTGFVRVDSEHPDKVRFPKIAVAATMSMPNVGVSEEAVELMQAALGMKLEPGLGDADMQYWANALSERLHLPAEALGWTASTDYRSDRLSRKTKTLLKPSGAFRLAAVLSNWRPR